ncbi:hypothetical protein B0H21DRAFT_56789 [Amylocystis lapponica]|nr:hypothetical protein B0H21DRAFT_56789 [Amylocystis lapponica]
MPAGQPLDPPLSIFTHFRPPATRSLPFPMQYASPSPECSLPTPPHSPTAQEPSHSAIILLDSLSAFYQQERYWVHHTRAALELALTKGVDARAITYPTPSPSVDTNSLPSSSSSSSAAASPASAASPCSDDAIIKEEPNTPPPMDGVRNATRWARRKNIMRLKLDGITHHSRRTRPHRAPPSEPGARLLEMFSELVDARMESCHRVTQLVRDANRPDLCMC